MTLTVARFNAMSAAEAAFRLAACCGASAWVAGMLTRRPFGSRDDLFTASADVARTLREADWLEAFAHHPRIGERRSNAAVSTSAESWSAGEQSASAMTSPAIRAALAEANADYDKRFGFIFIICANGRSAEDILAALRGRMGNEPSAEIVVAAHEQQQITRLRLENLISEHAVGA